MNKSILLAVCLTALAAMVGCGPGGGGEGFQAGDLMVKNNWNEPVVVSVWVYSGGKEDGILREQEVAVESSIVEMGAIKIPVGDPFAWAVATSSESFPETELVTGSSIVEPAKALVMVCAYDLVSGGAIVLARWED